MRRAKWPRREHPSTFAPQIELMFVAVHLLQPLDRVPVGLLDAEQLVELPHRHERRHYQVEVLEIAAGFHSRNCTKVPSNDSQLAMHAQKKEAVLLATCFRMIKEKTMQFSVRKLDLRQAIDVLGQTRFMAGSSIAGDDALVDRFVDERDRREQ